MRFQYTLPVTLFALLFLCLIPQISAAQDDVESLGRILNEPGEYRDGKAVTGEDFANMYYEKCVSEKQDVFVEREREILCTCMAAKMSETLTLSEFQALERKTVAGRDARGKVVAFAHLPCMSYVMDSKIHRECRKLPVVQKLITGKNTLCGCTKNRYKKYLIQNASFIAQNARLNEPMSMNPLAIFFEGREHNYHIKNFTKKCKFDIDYNKYN